MRYLLFLLLCSMSLLMANCAASGSSTSTRKKPVYAKTFQTGKITANFSLNFGGLGRSNTILYQVKAYCMDARCNSSKVVLSFYLGSGGGGGSNTILISNQNLGIQAGDKNYYWNKGKPINPPVGTPIGGKITAVFLEKSALQQIAQSKKVTVVLVGKKYSWSYNNRKPLRSLVQKLEKSSG